MPPIGVRPGQADRPPSVGGGLASLAHAVAASTQAPAFHSTYRPPMPAVPSAPPALQRAYGASSGPPPGTRLFGLARLPLSGQVKAIQSLLSKGGYMQAGRATGQDPWKLLVRDSNSYDRQLLSAIQRNVAYAQALSDPALTRQAVNNPMLRLDFGGRGTLPYVPPNPQSLGPVPTGSMPVFNYHGTLLRQPYTPVWKAPRDRVVGRGQRDIYTGQLIPANIPRVNLS